MNRILIYDAHPSIRELVAEELSADGNIVVPVANPESIPSLIATLEPDLFILEPCIHGKMDWDLFHLVKMQDPKIPILLFTDWSSTGPGFEKADACLPKSHNLEKLRQEVKNILKKNMRMNLDPGAVSAPGSRGLRF